MDPVLAVDGRALQAQETENALHWTAFPPRGKETRGTASHHHPD